MRFATWTDLEGIILNEIMKKKGQVSYGFTYMWNLKSKLTNRKRLPDTENEQMVATGKWSEGISEIGEGD